MKRKLWIVPVLTALIILICCASAAGDYERFQCGDKGLIKFGINEKD